MGIEDIVLDASMIVAFQVKEKYGKWVGEQLSHYFRFHILEITPYEMFNAIHIYNRRKELSQKEFVRLIDEAYKFLADCRVHTYHEVYSVMLKLSTLTGAAVYDSAYIALARKLQCKLLTVDLALYNKLSKFPDFQNVLIVPEK